MKIYSSSNRKYNFTYFVGKDIWVKCRCNVDAYIYFIKFQSIQDDRITYEQIEEYWLLHPDEYADYSIRVASCNRPLWLLLNYYEICNPLECYTTEELHDILGRVGKRL